MVKRWLPGLPVYCDVIKIIDGRCDNIIVLFSFKVFLKRTVYVRYNTNILYNITTPIVHCKLTKKCENYPVSMIACELV